MESNPIGSNLLLVVFGWLCFMLHVRWSDKRAAACPTPPTPTPPRRMRSPDPQPCAGLIHKPVSEACECARNARPQPPSSPPPALTFTRGRKRHIDPPSQFCPAPNCSSYGWSGRGTIRSNGHPGGTPWRQLASVACCSYVPETLGTLLHGTRVSPQMLVWAVGALTEGLGIRAVAWVFEVDPNTVLPWLVETADHATAFLPYFLHDVRVQQVQLDELFALFSVIKDGTISETEAIARLDRSPHEVWAAMDPESKLWLASDPGERTLAMAQRFVQHVIPVLAPDCAPLWLTDGFREYLTAWVTLSGQWVQPYRRQAPGPTPKLRWWPQPGLLYAQVRKQYRRRRLVGMCPRVVFGTRDAVHAVLAPLGWQINTAFIERLHLDMRQHVAALGRRVNTLCKHDAGLRQQ